MTDNRTRETGMCWRSSQVQDEIFSPVFPYNTRTWEGLSVAFVCQSVMMDLQL